MHEQPAVASHVLDFVARRLWSTTGRRVDLAAPPRRHHLADGGGRLVGRCDIVVGRLPTEDFGTSLLPE